MDRLEIPPESEKRAIYPHHMRFDRGIAIPGKMLSSGQDGYRTPTIEDYEKHSKPSSQNGAHMFQSHLSSPGGVLSILSETKNHLSQSFETLGWRQRLRHFTWTFFTMTMATGGIGNVLYAVPFRFQGLDTIGTIFFLFNLVLFIVNVILISLRFHLHPETFKASVFHPTESLFVPAAVVSFGTMLIIGPHAAVLSSTLSSQRALSIIVGGFTLQGIGYLVSLTVYAAFIYRLMTQKLPKESLRPGMFISVGPSAFTAGAVINMAANADKYLPADYMGNGPMAAMILKVMADWIALWLWGVAIWFFMVSLGAHWDSIRHRNLTFTMSWYSFIFPNTALVTATFAVGEAFSSQAIQVVGCVMTCILVAAWFVVFGMMIRAIIRKDILWPQRQEDRDEGGFNFAEMKERGSQSHSEGSAFLRTVSSAPV
ncbi:hypothetical protein MMC13_001391 [Lambiella insularis]|nr:hypothetical protein [Lambiella insularis]